MERTTIMGQPSVKIDIGGVPAKSPQTPQMQPSNQPSAGFVDGLSEPAAPAAYPPAGNFVFSGNSSLEELATSLSMLTGQATDNTLSMVDGTWTELDIASICATDISNAFNGVNQSIVSSWAGVSDFADKINARVKTLTQSFTNELKAFIEATASYEQEIQLAAQLANDTAAQILNELGLN